MKKIICFLLSFVLVLGNVQLAVAAAEEPVYSTPDVDSIEMRVSGSFYVEAKANSRAAANQAFYYREGDLVQISGTFSPTSAKLSVGLIDENNLFYSASVTDGEIDLLIEIPATGNYRVGIKNNSNSTVTVRGTVSN